MAKPFDITEFPLEIFEIIAAFLDSSSYVEDHLEDDPEEVFSWKGKQIASDARVQHLKNASLVCRRWHTAFQPIVFRHLFVRLSLPELSLSTSDLARSCAMAVDFIEDNISTLSEWVQSATLFINDSIERGARRREADVFLDVDNGRITIVSEGADGTGRADDLDDEAQALLYDPFTEFWAALKHLMPKRMTLIGLDSHLAFYLPGVSNYAPLTTRCPRQARLRLFSMARNSKEVEQIVAQFGDRPGPPNPAKKILSIRCWTDVLLNEGSELRDWPKEDSEPDRVTRKDLYGLRDLSLGATMQRSIEEGCAYYITSLDGSFFASLTYVCQFGCYTEIAEQNNVWSWMSLSGGFDALVFRIRTLPHNFRLEKFLESPLARRVGTFKVREFYRHRFQETRFAIDLWKKFEVELECDPPIEFMDLEDRAWEKVASQTVNARWIRPCADRPGYVALIEPSPGQQ